MVETSNSCRNQSTPYMTVDSNLGQINTKGKPEERKKRKKMEEKLIEVKEKKRKERRSKKIKEKGGKRKHRRRTDKKGKKIQKKSLRKKKYKTKKGKNDGLIRKMKKDYTAGQLRNIIQTTHLFIKEITIEGKNRQKHQKQT